MRPISDFVIRWLYPNGNIGRALRDGGGGFRGSRYRSVLPIRFAPLARWPLLAQTLTNSPKPGRSKQRLQLAKKRSVRTRHSPWRHHSLRHWLDGSAADPHPGESILLEARIAITWSRSGANRIGRSGGYRQQLDPTGWADQQWPDGSSSWRDCFRTASTDRRSMLRLWLWSTW